MKFLFLLCIAQGILPFTFKLVNKKQGFARKVLCFFLRAAFSGTEVVLFHLFESVCYFKGVKQTHLQGSVTISCSEKKNKNCEAWHSKGNS